MSCRGGASEDAGHDGLRVTGAMLVRGRWAQTTQFTRTSGVSMSFLAGRCLVRILRSFGHPALARRVSAVVAVRGVLLVVLEFRDRSCRPRAIAVRSRC